MSLKFDTFRSQRYLRTRYLEGKFLLASEASDLELEMLDLSRAMIKTAIGNVCFDGGWKVSVYRLKMTLGTRAANTFEVNTTLVNLINTGDVLYKNGAAITTITSTSSGPQYSITVASTVGLQPGDQVEVETSGTLLIAPGEGWFEGLPFEMRSGYDNLVSGSSWPLGTTPNSATNISIQDEPLGEGKLLTFSSGGTTVTNNYQLVVRATEEVITNADDPFLKNVNIPESTAQKLRLVFYVCVVPAAMQTVKPIPYAGISGGNLSNYVEVIPQAGGNGELIASSLIPASPIDGGDLILTIRNNEALPNTSYPGSPVGNTLPRLPNDLSEYTSGILEDSVGQKFWINFINVDGNNITIRIDKEVGQPDPQIILNRPYKLYKREVYTVNSQTGDDPGYLNFSLANVFWESSTGFDSNSIEDLRLEIKSLAEINQIASQDRNLKLTKGGVWSWNQSTNTLNWTASAFVQAQGLLDTCNQINIGSILLPSDGSVAYIRMNRTNVPTVVTVLVDSIQNLLPTEDVYVIARRVGNNVLVANSFLLKHLERLELDGALAEINRRLDQLKITSHESSAYKVRVKGSDINQLDGSVLSQQLANLVLKFDGAVINFDTGDVLSFDDATPLGNNFIPFSIPSGQYFWYGIGTILDSPSADNRSTIKLIVTPASASSSVSTTADFPDIIGTQKLGAIQVYNNAGNIQVVGIRNIAGSSGGGGGSGVGKVVADYYDPVSIALPTTATVTIDGESIVNGNTVLFTNLSSGKNIIYQVDNIGTGATWTALNSFENSSQTPSSGDEVTILNGAMFKDQKPFFTENGEWLINNTVRFFDGDKGTNFWEMSSLKSLILSNNATTEIFRVDYRGSENMHFHYSMNRGSRKETGILYISTNGTDIAFSKGGADLEDLGVTFNVTLQGFDLVLSASSNDLVSNTSLKYFVKRWSDSPGGPSGIPTYSTGGGGDTPAAGTVGDVQIKGGDGNLAADTRLNWDAAGGILNLNNYRRSGIQAPIILADDQITPQVAVSFPLNRKFLFLEYSLERDGETDIGIMFITNNGTNASLTGPSGGTSILGLNFTADISGGNVRVLYTSTNTGFSTTLKYAPKWWN